MQQQTTLEALASTLDNGTEAIIRENVLLRRFIKTLRVQIDQLREEKKLVAISSDDYVLMPKKLTAENGAKALLSGEFNEQIEMSCPECADVDEDEDCSICDGSGQFIQRVTVDWTTIKDIYAKAVSRLSVPPPESKTIKLGDAATVQCTHCGNKVHFAMPDYKAHTANLLAALKLYEQAFDAMFAQCLSNGLKDAWGKPINCTLLNQAHQAASKAIASAETTK